MRTIALLLLLPALGQAAEPLRAPWSLVPAVCSDRKAIVKLTTGTRLEGRILRVSPTDFEMEVSRTSDKSQGQKGLQRLDRALLSELRVRDNRIAGRVIGTIAGVVYAFPVAWFAAELAGAVIALPAYVLTIALGHYTGRLADFRSRLVIIEPDAPNGTGE